MRRWVAAATAVIAAAALAGCAEDGPAGRQLSFGPAPSESTCPPIDGYPFPVADRGSADVSAAAVIEIDAGDHFFAPTCGINVPAGTVTLRVTNIGRMKHSVTIPDQGIDVDVLAGETVDVTVEVEDTGVPLVYVCKYHRTSGMVGALVTGA